MGRFRRVFLLFFLVALSGQIMGQMTLIQGNGFYYRGKMIEVHAYDDLFTFKTSLLSKMLIPQDGSFKFELNLSKEGLYLIKIGRVNAHVFITPGDEYTLVLSEPLKSDQYAQAKEIFILPEIFEAKGQLNYDITELEKSINQFLIEHSQYYGRGVSRKLLPLADSLTEVLKAKYADRQSQYFQTHLFYRLAAFDLQTNHSRNQVFNTYFKGRDPSYDHLSYANAFELFFQEYLDYLNPVKAHRWQSIADSALRQADFSTFMECMTIDPHLERRSIRELFAATQLYELGNERSYPLSTIQLFLDSLLVHASKEPCQLIAANAQELLNKLAPGTLAPDFEFTDLFGNINRLSEFKGRYIYVQFFDDFDSETLKQMSLMKVLKDGYGSDIAMFSISTHTHIRELKNKADEYNFKWFFGKALSGAELKTAYDLRALPMYFYLDKDLRFITSPAPPPGAKIEKLFAKAWNKEHPNKALRFKLQPPELEEETMLDPPR